MKLNEIYYGIKLSKDNVNINGISENSKNIRKNYIFFSRKNKKLQEEYIEEAIKNGAILIIHAKKDKLNIKKYETKCKFLEVEDINKSMSLVSKKFYKIKSKDFKIIGITGTNGKSTVSDYIAQLNKLKKNKVGLIGTLGNGVYPNLKNIALTTPNIISINKYISEFTKKNVSKIVIEVSSHGIKQRRTEGIIFDTVIFTNLTHDHMDYHKNMSNYYKTKLKLFTEYKSKKKIICIDNNYGKKIVDSIKNKKEIQTVSINNKEADFYTSNIIYFNNGIKFTIHSRYGTSEVTTKIYGEFAIINILTAIATLTTNKSNFIELANNISKLKSVNGRMNKYHKKGYPITFIDFAHTPEAAKLVINSIRKHFPKKKVVTIFGCGGERDNKKRKKMGKIISKTSDEIIITNDNPRNECQDKITKDIILGIENKKKYKVILSRSAAIKKALKKSNFNKIVLILGKGHEKFQVIKNKKVKFCDRDKVIKAMYT